MQSAALQSSCFAISCFAISCFALSTLLTQAALIASIASIAKRNPLTLLTPRASLSRVNKSIEIYQLLCNQLLCNQLLCFVNFVDTSCADSINSKEKSIGCYHSPLTSIALCSVNGLWSNSFGRSYAPTIAELNRVNIPRAQYPPGYARGRLWVAT